MKRAVVSAVAGIFLIVLLLAGAAGLSKVNARNKPADPVQADKFETWHRPAAESPAVQTPTITSTPTSTTPQALPKDVEILTFDDPITYNYLDLVAQDEFIRLDFYNPFTVPVTVTGEIVSLGLRDEDGQRLDEAQVFTSSSLVLSRQSINHLTFTVLYTGPLKPGVYKGFLVIRRENNDLLERRAINVAVPFDTTALPTFFQWVDELTHYQLQQIPWARFRMGTVEWIIVGLIFLVLLAWGIRLIRLGWWLWRGHPGSVDLAKITNSTGEGELATDGLTALMQERLATCGILPTPSVPGGSVEGSFSNVVETIPLDSYGAWFKTTVLFLRRIFSFKPGHRVTATLVKRTAVPEYGLTLEIKDAFSGKTEKIAPLWNNSYEAVVEQAAYYLYHYINAHPHVIRRTPVWARFSSATAYGQYQRGQRWQSSGRYDKAETQYRLAATTAPHNALVRFQLGNLLANQNEFLEAMEIYLEVLSIWPNLLEARYRLAVTYTFWEKLVPEWEQASAEKKSALLSLIATLVAENHSHKTAQNRPAICQEIESLQETYHSATPDQNVPNNTIWKIIFLELAVAEWEYLAQQLRWRALFLEWFRTLDPFNWRPHIRTYLGQFILFWRSRQRQFLRVVETAHCLTNFEQDPGCKDEVSKKIKKIISPSMWNAWQNWWKGINWQVRYNAVCFYSITENIPLALEQLLEVIRDPDHRLDMKWLREGDPDLKNLRSDPQFQVLFDTFADNGDEQLIQQFRFAWNILAAGADQHILLWWQRLAKIETWPKKLTLLQQKEANDWYQHQQELWSLIATWSKTPESEETPVSFWTKLHQGQSPLPNLPARQAGPVDKNQLEAYQEKWYKMEEAARVLSICYSTISREIRQISLAPQRKKMAAYSEQTLKIWLVLKYLADDPLDAANWETFEAAGKQNEGFGGLISRLFE